MGLNVGDRSTDDALAFVRKYGWDWPSIHDPRRARARALGAEYQSHVVAIDRQGRIVGGHKGVGNADHWGRLAALLR